MRIPVLQMRVLEPTKEEEVRYANASEISTYSSGGIYPRGEPFGLCGQINDIRSVLRMGLFKS